MNRKRDHRSAGAKGAQRGAATIEYALTLPIAIVLLLGSIDMGRAYLQVHALLEAAQAGVRIASLPNATTSQVQAAAQEILDPANVDDWQIQSSNVGGAASRGATSSVTVTAPFQTMTGSMIPGWTGVVTLTRTASMRHE